MLAGRRACILKKCARESGAESLTSPSCSSLRAAHSCSGPSARKTVLDARLCSGSAAAATVRGGTASRARALVGVATITLCAGNPTLLSSQSISVKQLAPANATLPGEFTRITGIRELSDGRAIVVDNGEHAVLVVDFATKKVEQIGRTGRGPGEYDAPRQAWALAGDSTLITDWTTRSWYYLAGTGIAATLTAEKPLNFHLSPSLSGVDTAGHALAATGAYRIRLRRAEDPTGSRDSLTLLRGHRGSARIDTLLRVRLRTAMTKETMKEGIPWVVPNPLATDDQALLFPDGWIAIAMLEPYHVDWLAPDGRRIRGAPIAVVLPAVDDREKRFAITRAYPPPQPSFAPEEFPPWPPRLPAFNNAALLATPSGDLLIRRAPSAGAPVNVIDVVSRTGALIGRLELPPNQSLIGVSRRWAFVVTTDNDGLQRLSRHPW